MTFGRCVDNSTKTYMLNRLSDRSTRYNNGFFIKQNRAEQRLTTLSVLRYSSSQ
jgi:hypothetical protein